MGEKNYNKQYVRVCVGGVADCWQRYTTKGVFRSALPSVDRLCNRVEPFAALLWTRGIVLTNTPTRRPGITPPPYTYMSRYHLRT